jgi:hypothetical protein
MSDIHASLDPIRQQPRGDTVPEGKVYKVEIDGTIYRLLGGDTPPTEEEARESIKGHTPGAEAYRQSQTAGLNYLGEMFGNVPRDLVEQGKGVVDLLKTTAGATGEVGGAIGSRVREILGADPHYSEGTPNLDALAGVVPGIVAHYGEYLDPEKRALQVREHPIGTVLDIAGAIEGPKGAYRGVKAATPGVVEFVKHPMGGTGTSLIDHPGMQAAANTAANIATGGKLGMAKTLIKIIRDAQGGETAAPAAVPVRPPSVLGPDAPPLEPPPAPKPDLSPALQRAGAAQPTPGPQSPAQWPQAVPNRPPAPPAEPAPVPTPAPAAAAPATSPATQADLMRETAARSAAAAPEPAPPTPAAAPATPSGAAPKIVTTADLDKQFPLAGKAVSGFEVRADIPNQASIESSLGSDYHTLPGVREVSMSDFYDPGHQPKPYSVSEAARLETLKGQLAHSKSVNPLIVVVDETQHPYILEGGHRLDALQTLGVKSFPAKIVVDTSAVDLRHAPELPPTAQPAAAAGPATQADMMREIQARLARQTLAQEPDWRRVDAVPIDAIARDVTQGGSIIEAGESRVGLGERIAQLQKIGTPEALAEANRLGDALRQRINIEKWKAAQAAKLKK